MAEYWWSERVLVERGGGEKLARGRAGSKFMEFRGIQAMI